MILLSQADLEQVNVEKSRTQAEFQQLAELYDKVTCQLVNGVDKYMKLEAKKLQIASCVHRELLEKQPFVYFSLSSKLRGELDRIVLNFPKRQRKWEEFRMRMLKKKQIIHQHSK